MHLGFREPPDSRFLIKEHLGPKASVFRFNFGVSVAIQRHIGSGHERHLEPRGNAELVERNDDVARGQMAMGIIFPYADDKHPAEIVRPCDISGSTVATLNFAGSP